MLMTHELRSRHSPLKTLQSELKRFLESQENYGFILWLHSQARRESNDGTHELQEFVYEKLTTIIVFLANNELD